MNNDSKYAIEFFNESSWILPKSKRSWMCSCNAQTWPLLCRRKWDYSKAFELLQKAANLGYLDGIYGLGLLYAEGKGVKRDYSKAFELLQKASNLGHVDSMYNLGVFYEYGKGASQVILQKSSQTWKIKCNVKSWCSLYKWKRSWKKDQSKAIEYFQKAADLGNRDATNNRKKINDMETNPISNLFKIFNIFNFFWIII